MSKDALQKIALGVAIPVLLALFWFLFGKGQMVWLHVDRDVPVSRQEAAVAEIGVLAAENKQTSDRLQATIAQAVQELNEQRRDLLAAPVRGKVSREIGTSPRSRNVIYLNSNSDARRFSGEKEVEVTYQGRSITASVEGKITNLDDLVVGQLNRDAADGLGITEARGVATVTIRRLMDPR